MSSIYQVRVTEPDGTLMGDRLSASTSVYADSPLEAKMAGAAQLGVSPDRVTVDLIPNVRNPSDDELRATWSDAVQEAEAEQSRPRTGGWAYEQ